MPRLAEERGRGKRQGRRKREGFERERQTVVGRTSATLSSSSLSFLLSLPFEPFFEAFAMQSRAAVLPLLAGLVLLCSATRAQVSVLFFFRNLDDEEIERIDVPQSQMGSLPRLCRKRAELSLSALACCTGARIAHDERQSLRGHQACGGVLRARWFLRDGQQIEAPSNASSFVFFSPRPHRQLVASGDISFELGDDSCRVA